jgi:hypothetical protein
MHAGSHPCFYANGRTASSCSVNVWFLGIEELSGAGRSARTNACNQFTCRKEKRFRRAAQGSNNYRSEEDKYANKTRPEQPWPCVSRRDCDRGRQYQEYQAQQADHGCQAAERSHPIRQTTFFGSASHYSLCRVYHRLGRSFDHRGPAPSLCLH